MSINWGPHSPLRPVLRAQLHLVTRGQSKAPPHHTGHHKHQAE